MLLEPLLENFVLTVHQHRPECVQHRVFIGEVTVQRRDRNTGAFRYDIGRDPLDTGFYQQLGRCRQD